MRYQNKDKNIPQRSVLIMLPYNIQIENSGPSYKCWLSFFEVFISMHKGNSNCIVTTWQVIIYQLKPMRGLMMNNTFFVTVYMTWLQTILHILHVFETCFPIRPKSNTTTHTEKTLYPFEFAQICYNICLKKVMLPVTCPCFNFN